MPLEETIQGIPDSDIDEQVQGYQEDGYNVTKVRKGDTWTVILVRDDSDIEGQRNPIDNVKPVTEGTPDTPPAVNHDQALGVLSERYESNGDPGAIGEDRTGGPSYGMYQIATKTGTMKKFLNFLAALRPDFAQTLSVAGGADAALQGKNAFKTAWRKLAEDQAFADAQHAFIQSTHYEPFVKRLKSIELDMNVRSFALKNAAWSVAVQHGPGNKVFHNALSGKQPPKMDDKAILNAVYAERSNVDKYFRRSTAAVKASVKRRFARELKDALQLLSELKDGLKLQ